MIASQAAGPVARATQRLGEIAWERQRERYLGLVDELVTRRRGMAAVRL